MRAERVTDDIVESHHQVVYRECGGDVCGEALYGFYRFCAAQVLKDDAELRELFGERFDALDEGWFAVQAELARLFAVYTKYEAEFFHHRDNRENGFEIADAVCAVGCHACGVVLACDNANGHHVLQVLFRVVRVQLERHERLEVRAHRSGGFENLLLVFCNGFCACHRGDCVRHDDGAAKLGCEIADVTGHKFALAQVRMKIVW